MPEGDTIHRAARTMQAALAGRVVTRFESVLPQLARVDVDAPLAGRTIERVRAEGKNLIIDFSGDLHLHTHMRMHGAWHLYRPGERWRKRRSDMRIVIETGAWIAVGFNVPIAAFHDAQSLARQEDLRNIGPDLLADTFDEAEALRRIRAREELEIADAITNQRLVSGIGNEYKSELLFLAHINPYVRVADVSDAKVGELLRMARKVMIANVQKRAQGRDTTFSLDPSQRKYVYGRGGQPCRKCGTAVQFAKQGRDARPTYWCPSCQPL
jgi:endonuclease-8